MLFWNDDISKDTQGLDILGIRALDQRLEANLVNGITTVSQRGRYFSILPWAIHQFYSTALAEGGKFEGAKLGAYLHRVEFLTIAASLSDPVGKAGVGLLGSDVYSDQMKKLGEGKPVDFPSSKGSRMLGTYYAPSKAIGLLDDGATKNGIPYLLTARGLEVWAARNEHLDGSSLLTLLWSGGTISQEDAELAISQFSLSGLDANSSEAKALRLAFTTPWQTPAKYSAAIERRYASFNATRYWLGAQIKEGPAGANRILSRNLQACSAGGFTKTASNEWAEFEWRRRQHYALELLLASACAILNDVGALSTDEIIEVVRQSTGNGGELESIWPDAQSAWEKTAKAAVESIPTELMQGQPLPFPQFRALKAAEKMLAAFALLGALEKQSRPFRKVDLDQPLSSTSDLALKLVARAGDAPFRTLLRELLENCALLPHLKVTLRKMSNGLKCSLRFFPDGEKLRLTANQSEAGFSGSRLDNTLGIMADIGILGRNDEGSLIAVAV